MRKKSKNFPFWDTSWLRGIMKLCQNNATALISLRNNTALVFITCLDAQRFGKFEIFKVNLLEMNNMCFSHFCKITAEIASHIYHKPFSKFYLWSPVWAPCVARNTARRHFGDLRPSPIDFSSNFRWDKEVFKYWILKYKANSDIYGDLGTFVRKCSVFTNVPKWHFTIWEFTTI